MERTFLVYLYRPQTHYGANIAYIAYITKYFWVYFSLKVEKDENIRFKAV